LRTALPRIAAADRAGSAGALSAHQEEGRPPADFAGAAAIPDESFWELESECLIPAALEQQITASNAGKIRTRLLLEGANGPTTPEADDILTAHGIVVVPDVIANAGGVTVSYFEWVQDLSSYFWSEDEVNGRLDTIMSNAFNALWETAQQARVRLRTAAFTLGPAGASSRRGTSEGCIRKI